MSQPSVRPESFDYTFDFTFTPDDAPTNVAADPCRLPGVYIGWLGRRGWGFYLFSGNADTDFTTSALGQYQQAGKTKDSLRIGQDQMTIRAGNIPKPYAEVLKTIFLSVKVYVIAPDEAGQTQIVQVYVDPGTVNVAKDNAGLSRIEARISFPTIKSQRG